MRVRWGPMLMVVAACRFDAAVPPGVTVTCASSDECPVGYRCGESQVCVANDVEPERLSVVRATVMPQFAKAGTPIVIDVVLGGAWSDSAVPTLELSRFNGLDPTRIEATSVEHGEPEGHVRFAWSPRGDETEGAQRLTLSIVDLAQTRRTLPVPGDLTLDFHPPAVISQTLSLSPPDGGPLRDVTAVGVAVAVRVVAAFDEPIRSSSLDAGGVIDFSTFPESLTRAHYDGVLGRAGVPQGPLPLTLEAEDLAGNLAAVTLTDPPIIDTVPPAGLDTSVDGGVVLHRAAWGSRARAGNPGTFVSGITVTEPVTVRATLDPAAARELARVLITPPQPVALELGGNDQLAVWLSPVDGAGNAGPAALVHRVEWAAIFTSDVSQAPPSPHEVETSRVDLPQRHVPGNVLNDVSPLTAIDFDGGPASAVVIDSAGAYLKRSGVRPYHASGPFLTDPATGRPMHLGPVDAGLSSSSVAPYRWDELQWAPMLLNDPEGDGEPAFGPTVPVVDTARGLLVGVDLLGMVWEYDGVSWRRIDATDPEGDGDPGARSTTRLVYDEEHDVVLLLGGARAANPGFAYVDDTWEWNGRSWRLVHPGDAGPARAGNSAFAAFFDPVLRSVVGFGGFVGGGSVSPVGTTWVLDRADGGATWSVAAAALPVRCRDMAVAYDRFAGRAVTGGGITSPIAVCPVQVWSSATRSWVALTDPAAPAGWVCPPVWNGAAARIDYLQCDNGLASSDGPYLHSLASGATTFVRSLQPELPRGTSDFAWAPARQSMALLNRVPGSASVQLWNGAQREPDAGLLDALCGAGFVFAADERASRTWIHETDGTSCTALYTLGASLARVSATGGPTTRFSPALAALGLGDGGSALLHQGGYSPTFGYLNDTWLFDGQWHAIDAGALPAVPVVSLAPLADGAVAALLKLADGGREVDVLRETAGWQRWQTATVAPPGPGASGAEVWAADPLHGGALLQGIAGLSSWSETRGWSPVPVVPAFGVFIAPPGPMQWDPARQRMVYAAGNDLQELLRSELRPTVTLQFSLADARLPAPAVVERLEVEAIASGTGGAELRLFSTTSGWAAAPWVVAPASAPGLGPVRLTVVDPFVLRALFRGDAPLASVRVQPAQAAGAGGAQLVLDYAELHVVYVVP